MESIRKTPFVVSRTMMMDWRSYRYEPISSQNNQNQLSLEISTTRWRVDYNNDSSNDLYKVENITQDSFLSFVASYRCLSR